MSFKHHEPANGLKLEKEWRRRFVVCSTFWSCPQLGHVGCGCGFEVENMRVVFWACLSLLWAARAWSQFTTTRGVPSTFDSLTPEKRALAAVQDWHKAFIGRAVLDPPPLVAYPAANPEVRQRTASHLFVATEKNGLACVNPRDGTTRVFPTPHRLALASVVVISCVRT